MDVFEIVFSENAAEEFRKLPDIIKARIKEKFKKIDDDPVHYFERLKSRTDYKLRIGDYRLVADIHFDQKKIEVTKVGHRRNVYQEP